MSAGRRRADVSLWGDGFVDEGFDFFWSARSSEDVDDDELVFLLPLLPRSSSFHDAGLESRLRRILVRRAKQTIDQIWDGPGSSGGTEGRCSVESLHRLGYLTSLHPSEVMRDIERLPPASRSSGRPYRRLDPFGWRREARSLRDALAIERLASIDRLHDDARRPEPQRRSTSVASGVFASMSSCINAAYVYPELACMHQTMAVGAWLGHVLQGRPALMPLPVAEPLYGILTGRGSPTDDLIRAHLDPAGTAALVAAARRVARDGRARRIGARRFVSPSRSSMARVLTLVAAACR